MVWGHEPCVPREAETFLTHDVCLRCVVRERLSDGSRGGRPAIEWFSGLDTGRSS